MRECKAKTPARLHVASALCLLPLDKPLRDQRLFAVKGRECLLLCLVGEAPLADREEAAGALASIGFQPPLPDLDPEPLPPHSYQAYLNS